MYNHLLLCHLEKQEMYLLVLLLSAHKKNSLRFSNPQKSIEVWRGMEMFLDNPVPADDLRLPPVYDMFQRNVTDICNVGQDAGAAILLSTVAVNLYDFPPFASRHRPGLTSGELEDWESTYQAGVELEQRHQWSAALNRYESAAQIDDRFAGLQYRMGKCLAALDRFEEARTRFQSACNLDVLRFRADRKINEAIRNVASGQKRAGVHLVDAEKLLAPELPKSEDYPAETLFFEHVHFTFDGNYLLARSILDTMDASLPQLAKSDRSESVLTKDQCARALAMTPFDEHESLEYVLAIISRPPFSGRDARTVQIRKHAHKLHRLLLKPDTLRDARETYETALDKTPDNWNLHYRYGMVLLESGDPKRAAVHLRTALDAYPWNLNALTDLGQAEQLNGRYEESIALYERALAIEPEFVDSRVGLGLVFSEQGRLDKAHDQFRKALNINPHHEAANVNTGVFLSKQGKYKEAVDYFRKALEINSQNPLTCYNLGDTLLRQGRIDEAVLNLQRAVDLNPDYEKAHSKLGSVLKGRGDIEKGISHFLKAAAINPRNAGTYFRLGEAEVARGRITDAVSYYRKALAVDPRFMEAHLDIGTLLGAQGRMDEAMIHVQRAVEITPGNARAYYILGKLLIVRGQTEEAIANFQKALTIRPGFEEALKELQSLQ